VFDISQVMEKYTTRQVLRAVGCSYGWLRDSLRKQQKFIRIKGTGGGAENQYTLDEVAIVDLAYKCKRLGIGRKIVKEAMAKSASAVHTVSADGVSVVVDFAAIKKQLKRRLH
jgi:hypothetical protein